MNPSSIQLAILNYILLQVKLEKGIQVLKIFKEHSSKTCILDDFEFYEVREKTIKERKSKEQQLPKQVICTFTLLVTTNKFWHLTCFCMFYSFP